jgi:hypothetical protein
MALRRERAGVSSFALLLFRPITRSSLDLESGVCQRYRLDVSQGCRSPLCVGHCQGSSTSLRVLVSGCLPRTWLWSLLDHHARFPQTFRCYRTSYMHCEVQGSLAYFCVVWLAFPSQEQRLQGGVHIDTVCCVEELFLPCPRGIRWCSVRLRDVIGLIAGPSSRK